MNVNRAVLASALVCAGFMSTPRTGAKEPLKSDFAKLVATLRGHRDMVRALALSPDNKWLFSGSSREVKVWDLDKESVKFTLNSHTDKIMALAASPDGKRVYSAGIDKTVKVWDLEAAGKEVITIDGHKNGIMCLALSKNGKRLFSGGPDGTIMVRNLDSGKDTRIMSGHRVMSLAVSQDGKRLFSGAGSILAPDIKVWDVETCKEVMTLLGHKDRIWGLAASPSGKRLYSGSEDGTIKVWDIEAGKEVGTLPTHHPVFGLALSEDGKRLVACYPTMLSVWDVDSSKHLFVVEQKSNVRSVALTKDGMRAYVGCGDYTIKVWQMD